MEWFLASFLVSVIVALRSDINRRKKLDGFRLNFWTSAYILLGLLPMTFLWAIHQIDVDAWFYLTAIFCGVGQVIISSVKFNLAAHHNGRVSNMEGPVKTFFAFGLWLVLDATFREGVFMSPVKIGGVLAMFAIGSWALNRMRRHDTSFKTFMIVAPIGVLAAVADIFAKIALTAQSSNFIPAITIFLCVLFFVNVMVCLPIIIIRRTETQSYLWGIVTFERIGRPIFVKEMMQTAAVVAVTVISAYSAFYYALSVAPNPAYPSAICMLTPMWLLLYHRLKGIRDDANPIMGTLMVASAIGLVLITSW